MRPDLPVRSTWLTVAAVIARALLPLIAACGAEDGSGGGRDGRSNDVVSERTLQSLSLDPPRAEIVILNGIVFAQKLVATARYSDGSSEPITNDLSWSTDAPAVGAIDSTGVFTPSGQLGGAVTITASHAGHNVRASLAVKLHDSRVASSVDPGVQAQLKVAVTPDPSVVWTYPYDGTVFPRGLHAVPMMWKGAAGSDLYYLHIASPYFEMELVMPGLTLTDVDWTRFTESTSGAADLVVSRWNGRTATQIMHHTWTVAPASVPGAVYYWAKDPGRLMRLEPGAEAPEDFTKDVIPTSATAKCTFKCHTVSADGSTLVGSGSTFGGSYDLRSNKLRNALGSESSPSEIGLWGLSALSPDGQYVVSDASGMTGVGTASTMFKTGDGSTVASSGLPNELMWMPAFAPSGKSIAYVSGGGGNGAGAISPGALRVMDYDASKSPMTTNARDVVQAGADKARAIIAHPTVSPDGRFVAYGRLPARDPKGQQNLSSLPYEGNAQSGDIYLADVTNGTEVRLGKLGGDDYPFAAGARDRRTSFEPSFNPKAAGGYNWVVFHSRRTYGTVLTGTPAEVKQLWIAAIDADPKQGQDPSHPAFRLSGQAAETLNQRGIFAMKPSP